MHFPDYALHRWFWSENIEILTTIVGYNYLTQYKETKRVCAFDSVVKCATAYFSVRTLSMWVV